MRKFKYLIVFIVVFISACSKGEKVCCDTPEDDSIFMRANRADSVWQTNYVETRVINDSLYLFGNRGSEHIRLVIKPTSTGRYYITPQSGSFYITVGGDVMGAEYRATANMLNQVNITGYDIKKGLIQGEFDVMFIKDGRYAELPYVNNVNFLQGRFRAELP